MKQLSTIPFCLFMFVVAFPLVSCFAQSSPANPGGRPDKTIRGDPALMAEASGSAHVSDVPASYALMAGISVDSTENGLPDAPSVRHGNDGTASPATANHERNLAPSPALWAKPEPVANLPYWATTAAVFGSNIAAIELLQGCLAAKECQSIPGSMQSRAAMYGVGLPVAAGVSLLGYYLKKKQKRWWYVPAAMATAFDLFFVVHGAEK